MKGLEQYIEKYGNHFTEELASDITLKKWDSSKIQKSAQKKVYYNVTGSTSGDMMYLMDMFCYFTEILFFYRYIPEFIFWNQYDFFLYAFFNRYLYRREISMVIYIYFT